MTHFNSTVHSICPLPNPPLHYRFLPEPLVVLMRSKESSASLVSLDEVCETPELIWTAEMQMELRTAVATLLGGQRTVRSSPLERARGLEGSGFFTVPSMAQDFKVTYRQLDEEIYVGNVYIRLFMKQPTFRLSNPIFFLERLVELWEHSFNKQVPLANSSTAPESSGAGTGTGRRNHTRPSLPIVLCN